MPSAPVTVRFWGVRGSVPTPGRATTKVGGNTACIQLNAGGDPVVFDAGTGLREMGRTLLADPPPKVHLLLSHYHWDHMLGLPFFPPVFGGRTHVHVYGERKRGGGPKEAVARQFAAPHFPVDFGMLNRNLSFHDVKPGDAFRLGRTSIRVGRLNHPQGAVGYRATVGGRVFVYASDHEHDGRGDKELVRFCKGAHVLVYDAMYTGSSYDVGKKGWGHSTWEEGCRVARDAGVDRLFLFHHDPVHDDRQMLAIERQARRLFRGASVAREGSEVPL